ncbi:MULTISPECIES: hypothetical protein [unclassified Paenibacillus]|uniref:hypothetical protein n=1 Tax=unclassified Paenibacillus TaxID=185978 RepID=UPI002405AD97|nr:MULTISPECIES: hypothetical protein [unclassified Paenibacillus]MDF9841286.1 hypothetical protein [Paenibacillus sp. PastF-2]MDF9847877.1 hypothetical protein [Paenibacillus sp. PastM-2]MDF9854445.1 hypothetical protein [Paenibacillus sp. PastF-1]MDH6479946.1 hypothetical protein [Paenibacillus sp. PastH-2]MDH6507152.1 hypothetical protein [Paenibacillus sp. PastM-3]
MKRLKWNVLIYSVLFVVVLYMTLNEYSPIWIVGATFVAFLIAFTTQFYYPAVLDKRVDRVESFLRSQKKNPALYIQYVLANRLEDEMNTVMEQLMSKNKRVTAQAPFKAAYGLYLKDMAAVHDAVPHIRYSDYRAYYETALLVEEGKSAEAREHLESIKKQWMRSALLAEVERKAGNSEAAVKYAKEAIDASGGVQRYVLHKEYERTLPQAVGRVS